MKEDIGNQDIEIGVVGLGLMGTSIIVSLLLAGHRVQAIAPVPGEKEEAPVHIENQLRLCAKSGFLQGSVSICLARLSISENYEHLHNCKLVLECVIEEMEVKSKVFRKVNSVVKPDTVIASNTSAIPISILQRLVSHPERFIGIHWAEPAYLTRFLEITSGDQTSADTAAWVFALAQRWGKEPTLLKKDIRGFLTNRLMYAVYREALFLVENGQATLEDVDKAFRYDAGSWMTFMGIFRRMDFLGLRNYVEIFDTVFPSLSNADNIPSMMQQLVDVQARGTKNCKGLYAYTDEEARKWDEAFVSFSDDIFQLAALYPSKRSEHNDSDTE